MGKKKKKTKRTWETDMAEALRKALNLPSFKRKCYLPDCRRQWDATYDKDGIKFLVEFDGPEHYTKVLQVKIDDEKDAIASKNGCRTIRFPFWVAWDSETARHFFGLNIECRATLQHGFPGTPHLPATFCAPGVTRFYKELNELPAGVKAEVIETLRTRAQAEGGEKYVMPAFLMQQGANPAH